MAKINLKISQILVLALVIRLILSPLTFHGDVTVNYWWGKFAFEFPLRGFYDWLEFGGYAHPDQPPLYIHYYRFIRYLFVALHDIFWQLNITFPLFPSKFMLWFFLQGNQILQKIPIIFIEVLTIYFIYLFIRKHLTSKEATSSALFLTFYPPFLYNSALWGGNDILVNFFGLTGIYFLYHRRYLIGSLLFTSSLLFKSSLFIFLPLILIILIKQKPSLKSIFISFVGCLAYVYLVSRPFAILPTFFWLPQTYISKILTGSMPQLTANAFNFWGLIFGVYPPINDSIFLFNLIPARQLSLVFTLIIFSVLSIRLFQHYNLKNMLLTLTNLSLMSFTFLTRMHERYTFPALIPLFLLSTIDKRFRKYFWVLTITHLLNLYHWWWFPNISFLIKIFEIPFFIQFISLINLILALKLFSYRNVK